MPIVALLGWIAPARHGATSPGAPRCNSSGTPCLHQAVPGRTSCRLEGARTGSTARTRRPHPALRPSGSPAIRTCRRCPAAPRGQTSCGPCPRCAARTCRPGGGNRGSCRARCARSRCAGIPSVTAGTARERPRSEPPEGKVLRKYSVRAPTGSIRVTEQPSAAGARPRLNQPLFRRTPFAKPRYCTIRRFHGSLSPLCRPPPLPEFYYLSAASTIPGVRSSGRITGSFPPAG